MEEPTSASPIGDAGWVLVDAGEDSAAPPVDAGHDATSGAQDAGDAGEAPDASPPSPDAGDAGESPDASPPHVDAGDAGETQDASPPPQDAGDAGETQDASPPPQDAGDAGESPDASPPHVDAGEDASSAWCTGYNANNIVAGAACVRKTCGYADLGLDCLLTDGGLGHCLGLACSTIQFENDPLSCGWEGSVCLGAEPATTKANAPSQRMPAVLSALRDSSNPPAVALSPSCGGGNDYLSCPSFVVEDIDLAWLLLRRHLHRPFQRPQQLRYMRECLPWHRRVQRWGLHRRLHDGSRKHRVRNVGNATQYLLPRNLPRSDLHRQLLDLRRGLPREPPAESMGAPLIARRRETPAPTARCASPRRPVGIIPCNKRIQRFVHPQAAPGLTTAPCARRRRTASLAPGIVAARRVSIRSSIPKTAAPAASPVHRAKSASRERAGPRQAARSRATPHPARSRRTPRASVVVAPASTRRPIAKTARVAPLLVHPAQPAKPSRATRRRHARTLRAPRKPAPTPAARRDTDAAIRTWRPDSASPPRAPG